MRPRRPYPCVSLSECLREAPLLMLKPQAERATVTATVPDIH